MSDPILSLPPALCPGCGERKEQTRCLGCLAAGIKYGRGSWGGATKRHNAKRRQRWKDRRRARHAEIEQAATQAATPAGKAPGE